MALIDLFLKQQKELTKLQAQVLKRLVDAYGSLYKRLLPQIHNVELLLEANPEMSPYELERSQEYKDLLDAIRSEADDFTAYTRVELSPAVLAVMGLAVSHTGDFFKTYNIPATTIPADALNIMDNLLAEGGKLYERMKLWAPNVVDQVRNAILEGVKLGRNPRVIASDIQKAFGVGLTDALRTTRTAQLYAYRESTRANYIANNNVVKGWIWLAELDDRTCMSCLAMHGTIHGLDETLNDHHNGRCAMIPYMPGVDYGLQNAEDWFNALSDAQKTKQMGTGRYDAYKSGLFQFSQLSKERDDEVYGKMRVETPLKELI